MNRSVVLSITGAAAVASGVVLTWFLLSPNPWVVFGAGSAGVEETVDSTTSDFVQHAGCYAVWTLLLLASARASRSRVACWGVMGLAFAHAIVCEALQAIVPLRVADFPDGMANAVGVAAAVLFTLPLWWPVATGSPGRLAVARAVQRS